MHRHVIKHMYAVMSLTRLDDMSKLLLTTDVTVSPRSDITRGQMTHKAFGCIVH